MKESCVFILGVIVYWFLSNPQTTMWTLGLLPEDDVCCCDSLMVVSLFLLRLLLLLPPALYFSLCIHGIHGRKCFKWGVYFWLYMYVQPSCPLQTAPSRLRHSSLLINDVIELSSTSIPNPMG